MLSGYRLISRWADSQAVRSLTHVFLNSRSSRSWQRPIRLTANDFDSVIDCGCLGSSRTFGLNWRPRAVVLLALRRGSYDGGSRTDASSDRRRSVCTHQIAELGAAACQRPRDRTGWSMGSHRCAAPSTASTPITRPAHLVGAPSLRPAPGPGPSRDRRQVVRDGGRQATWRGELGLARAWSPWMRCIDETNGRARR